MPLLTLIEGRTFDDETIAAMSAAYQAALAALGIKDRSDPLTRLPLTRLIAETVIAVADSGVREQHRLYQETVARFLRPQE
jgi:hypothetical protein